MVSGWFENWKPYAAEYLGEKWNDSWIGCGFYVTKKRFVVTRNHTPFFVHVLVFSTLFSECVVNVFRHYYALHYPSFFVVRLLRLYWTKIKFSSREFDLLIWFWSLSPKCLHFSQELAFMSKVQLFFSLATTPKWPNRYFSLGFSDCMQDCHC